ncbi:GNAT family N-acetyltransferase [Adhaeribacter pallidiroseus]|uniref:Ribosomal-protein-alanine N-acetyltransferase n=1 Tax=Adhaeribacter pallidiroseus TaxID=2072847 RepID=A0A369QN83_9BACT|nr:GNAT family N-acetyltransferase [Adhaeribacter pallidiroseus]RDC64319.1 Ribosomal-protein-alanine N-acetyltransferase [Adhaeribacter pallidiroseus]
MLQTERLHIELANPGDKEFIFRLLNSPNWLKYIGDRGIKTLEDAENYIRNALIKNYHEKGFGLYKLVLKADKTPIGICGFLKRDYLDSVDIGYAVLPAYEEKGYTLEAAAAVMDYGKTYLSLQTVYGITTEANLASRHILEKLGLQLTHKRPDPESKYEWLVYATKK